ncbi:Cutinase [Venturia nashicola]|nr:Cutinase [Venturia nashicola]
MPSFAHPLLYCALAAAAALPQLPDFTGLAIPSIPSFGGGSSGSTPSIPAGLPGLGSGFGSGTAVPTGLPSLGSGLGSGFGGGFGSASGSIPALPMTPTTSSPDAASAGPCTDIMLIFARGTGEAQGFGSVGGPLDSALKKQFTSYSSYAVVYPAGFSQNSASGSDDALKKMTSVIASCPNTKFIVSGYSQGASLCHGIKATGAMKNAVSSVVLFGDPYFQYPGNPSAANLPVNDNSRIFDACNSGDTVCGKPNALGTGSSHLGYGTVVPAAAAFAKKQSGT